LYYNYFGFLLSFALATQTSQSREANSYLVSHGADMHPPPSVCVCVCVCPVNTNHTCSVSDHVAPGLCKQTWGFCVGKSSGQQSRERWHMWPVGVSRRESPSRLDLFAAARGFLSQLKWLPPQDPVARHHLHNPCERSPGKESLAIIAAVWVSAPERGCFHHGRMAQRLRSRRGAHRPSRTSMFGHLGAFHFYGMRRGKLKKLLAALFLQLCR